MSRKVMLRVAAACLATALLIPAHAGAEGARPAARKPTIVLLMKSLANEFFLTMEDGARRYWKDHRAEFDLVSRGIKDERDVEQQIQIVDQMIAQGVDAIVIAPADSKALVPVCAKARAEGIVVVNIDNKLDDDVLKSKGLRIPFVGPDNSRGAEAVGRYLAAHLRKGDKVSIIEGIPTALNAIERTRGFTNAMLLGGMNVVSVQTGLWEMDKASTVAAAMLTEYPDLKAILCGNDSMALGAVSAVKAAGRREVLVVGFDNISAVNVMLRKGTILATADQHADLIAVTGIQYALQALRTGVETSDVETPVDLVTP